MLNKENVSFFWIFPEFTDKGQPLVILFKARINFRVICSVFERIIANKTESLQIHFIHVSHDWVLAQKLKSVILKGMKKYKIESVMVTTLDMWRRHLITKEKMIDFCKGKEDLKESVNDDLESFFEDIRLGKKPKGEVATYFLPKLTEDELDLVEEKDNGFMKTFWREMDADVDKAEMDASESDSKYVYGYSYRKTFTIENPLPKNDSNGCSLQ